MHYPSDEREKGILLVPVPPLLSAGKPLPEGIHVRSGQLGLSVISGNGLRIVVRNDAFQGTASHSPEFHGGPLIVQVVPVDDDILTIDDMIQLDDYVRSVHGDASRLMLESFVQFEDIVQAHQRGATTPPPEGWGVMPIQVFETDPFRGMRTAVALAASHYLNANVPS